MSIVKILRYWGGCGVRPLAGAYGEKQIPGDKLANTFCRYSVPVIQPGRDDDGKRLQVQNQVWKLHTGLVQPVTMLISGYQ